MQEEVFQLPHHVCFLDSNEKLKVLLIVTKNVLLQVILSPGHVTSRYFQFVLCLMKEKLALLWTAWGWGPVYYHLGSCVSPLVNAAKPLLPSFPTGLYSIFHYLWLRLAHESFMILKETDVRSILCNIQGTVDSRVLQVLFFHRLF